MQKERIKDYFRVNAFSWICFLGAIVLLLCIPSQIKESLFAQAGISPRFFPKFSLWIILLCSGSLLGQDAYRRFVVHKPPETKSRDENVSYPRSCLVIGLLFLWLFALPRVGIMISMAVMVFLLSYLLGNRNKVTLVVFPIVFSVGVYFVFAKLLHVNLPEILL